MPRPKSDDLPANMPYWERLAKLRERAGFDQRMDLRDEIMRLAAEGKVTLPTARRKGGKFNPYWSIVAHESEPEGPLPSGDRSRPRYPSTEMLELYSVALGVKPDVFPEYRLQKARDLLDDRKVTLDEALANLERSGLDATSRGKGEWRWVPTPDEHPLPPGPGTTDPNRETGS